MSRSYYYLWFGYLISQTGNWLYTLALPLEVYRLTGSSFHMATLYGVEFLPWLLFSILGGLLADKVNKKYLLLIGDLASLAFVTLLTMLLYRQNQVQMWLVYPVVFCLASLNPLTHPAFQSILPALVSKEQLTKANSAVQLVENSISLFGPMVGGAVLAMIGGANAFLIDGLTFLVSAILIYLIPYRHVSRENAQGGRFLDRIGRDLRDGLQHVGQNKIVLFGSILFFFTNFAINIFQSNYMFYLSSVMNFSPSIIGLTIGLQGIGSLIGSLVAPLLGRRLHSGKLILMSTTIAGLCTLLLIPATTFWQIAVVQAAVMVCGNVNVVTYFSLRQRSVPTHLLGRVVSVTRMISYMSIPVSAFAGGIALQKGMSVYALIAIAGIIRLVVGLGGYVTPLASKETPVAA